MKKFISLTIFSLLAIFGSKLFAEANYVYHEATTNDVGCGGYKYRNPYKPVAGQAVSITFKVEFQNYWNQARIYYTIDGSNPSASKGSVSGTTQQVTANWVCGFGSPQADVVTANIPAQVAGTVIKYIVSAWHSGGGDEIFANGCGNCGSKTNSSSLATVYSYTVGSNPDATMQWPQTLEINFNANSLVFGRVFSLGITDTSSSPNSAVTAWIGYNTTDTNPNTWAESSWKTTIPNSAAFNYGSYDEYMTYFGYVSDTEYILPGTYYYASRFQINSGSYIYGGNSYNATSNEGGIWNGTTYKNGKLTVLTQIMPDLCGTTFSHPNNRIDAIPVSGANMYRFQFVENGNTTVITKSTNSVVWNELGAALKYNTAYQVKVAWSTDGGTTWTNYGAACTLTLGQTTYIYRGCGTTYSNPNMRIEALPLTNATEYTFEFTNTSTNAITEVVSTNPYTTFGLAGVAQGTYNIRVKAKINGIYGAYATVCNIIYAVPLDTTKLLSSFCGTTMGHSYHRMDAEARTGATAWMFKFVEGSNTYEIASATSGISFAALGANLKYNTPYTISVKYQKDGVWSEYGVSCNVSVSQLTYTYKQCGVTISNPNERIEALPILNATEYTFEFGTGGSTIVTTNPYTTFAASTVAAGTYSVRVKAKANGVYGDYGTACNITYAPATAKMTLYPNPFTDSFTISNISDAEVSIYDQNGNLREQQKISSSTKSYLGSKLEKGLYIVVIKKGNDIQQLQVIKK